MPDGDYELGSQRVQVREGVARLDSDDDNDAAPASLAGGTCHLIEVVSRAVRVAGVPLVDAVRAASQTPARILGLAGERGALLPGQAGDLVVVDETLRPLRVMKRGKWLA